MAPCFKYKLSHISLNSSHLLQGTAIVACQMLIHYDKKHFERPEEFYPNHFIGENGELLTKKEGYLPFSIGLYCQYL